MSPSQQDSNSPNQEQPPSRAEQVTFGIAAFILGAIAALVLFDWSQTKDQPPILTLSQKGEIRQVAGQYYLPFRVTNTGGNTAEAVQVLAELQLKGEVEEGEQQIDFLSDGEEEEGAFVFRHDPRQGELTLRIGSYKLP